MQDGLQDRGAGCGVRGTPITITHQLPHNLYLHKVAETWQQYDREKLTGAHLFPRMGRWYFASAGSRIEPSFFIPGVQKGGTTSLAQYLSEHPQIIQPQRKDIYYFNNAVNYSKGKNWYKAHFAHKLYRWLYEKRKGVKNTISFDPTPNYFPAPGAAERLKKNYPEAKIILLLRNPVERAWSNYRMCKWHGFENLSFEDALTYEDKRLAVESELEKNPDYHSYVRQRLAYRTNGIYVHYLREWQKHFQADQILVLRSEDLFEAPAKIYREVIGFLQLDRFDNVKFENFNKGKIEAQMDPGTRNKLLEFYEPYNRELYEIIHRNMNWS